MTNMVCDCIKEVLKKLEEKYGSSIEIVDSVHAFSNVGNVCLPSSLLRLRIRYHPKKRTVQSQKNGRLFHYRVRIAPFVVKNTNRSRPWHSSSNGRSMGVAHPMRRAPRRTLIEEAKDENRRNHIIYPLHFRINSSIRYPNLYPNRRIKMRIHVVNQSKSKNVRQKTTRTITIYAQKTPDCKTLKCDRRKNCPNHKHLLFRTHLWNECKAIVIKEQLNES